MRGYEGGFHKLRWVEVARNCASPPPPDAAVFKKLRRLTEYAGQAKKKL
jgi:hypothetical protein